MEIMIFKEEYNYIKFLSGLVLGFIMRYVCWYTWRKLLLNMFIDHMYLFTERHLSKKTVNVKHNMKACIVLQCHYHLGYVYDNCL